MLQKIRNSINNLIDKNFDDFYQEYVIEIQDSIIDHDVNIASKQYTSLEDTSYLIKGLNKITEELNKI